MLCQGRELLAVCRSRRKCRSTAKSSKAEAHYLQLPLEGGLFLRLRGFAGPLEVLLRGTFLAGPGLLGLVVLSYFFNICFPKYPTSTPETPATTAHVPGAIEEANAKSIERLPGVIVICARSESRQ
jgi:hypothetical protein